MCQINADIHSLVDSLSLARANGKENIGEECPLTVTGNDIEGENGR